MSDEIEETGSTEGDTSPVPKDLRAGLEADLKSAFNVTLIGTGTLPKVVCDSLVAFIGAGTPIAADLIVALGLEDPIQPEVPNE